jgi:hypothetical protein
MPPYVLNSCQLGQCWISVAFLRLAIGVIVLTENQPLSATPHGKVNIGYLVGMMTHHVWMM